MIDNPVRDLRYISQVRRQMNLNELMLCYRGEMTQDIVMALLNLTEKKLKEEDSGSTTRTRVFSVMVECLQNITQHSEKSKYSDSNMFMVGNTNEGYIIDSGNVIKREYLEDLKNNLQEIKTMTEEEIKEFSKYLIRHDPVEGESGLGLGLIHIARKTGNSLDFAFENIDDDHIFFSLRTLVDHYKIN